MTKERAEQLLNEAIRILELRLFDNYETEAMDNLEMTDEEYMEITRKESENYDSL